MVLRKYGFSADCFVDPQEALKSFRNETYDMVVLDIKMPEVSGFELYAQMKSIDNNVKALFLTALRELDDYEDFKSTVSPTLGERYFIQKPVSNLELIDHVNTLIG